MLLHSQYDCGEYLQTQMPGLFQVVLTIDTAVLYLQLFLNFQEDVPRTKREVRKTKQGCSGACAGDGVHSYGNNLNRKKLTGANLSAFQVS